MQNLTNSLTRRAPQQKFCHRGVIKRLAAFAGCGMLDRALLIEGRVTKEVSHVLTGPYRRTPTPPRGAREGNSPGATPSERRRGEIAGAQAQESPYQGRIGQAEDK